MSEEPRIQLEDSSGTVLDEIWADDVGDLFLEHTPSGNSVRISSSDFRVYNDFDVEGATSLGGGVSVDGNFDINGNQINNAQTIRGNGTPLNIFTEGASVNVYDSTNSQYVLRGLEGGDVEVPNGDLTIGGTRFQSSGDIKPIDRHMLIRTSGSGHHLFLYDDSNNETILSAKEGGNVEIPNGDLTVEGRHQPQRSANSGTIELGASELYTFHRQHIPSGKTLYIYEMGIQDESNTAPAGITVQAYDETNDVEISGYNTTFTEGTPLSSKEGSIDVSFRLNNDIAGTDGYNGYVLYAVV